MYYNICKQSLLRARANPLQQVKSCAVWQPARLKRETPEVFYSLKERLESIDIKLKDPDLYEKVNIGLPLRDFTQNETKKDRLEVLKEIRNNESLASAAFNRTLLVDIEQVEEESLKTTRPSQALAIAEHFHIFKDLFGEFAEFNPVIPMKILYEYDDSTLSPVYLGNLLKPKETSSSPHVEIKSDDPDSLWTLILTNPDGNLYEEKAEVLHWFVGNIEGNSIEKGEVVVPYLQPFPPRGTGYHRYVFILYKQEKRLDFSEYKQELDLHKLKSRTFETFKFYKKFEEDMTPAGLSFFQADWDPSLTDFFHKSLNMREPSYEYEFPKQYIAPQVDEPKRRAFNQYLDLHRDPKELSKDMLLRRLSMLHPFDCDLKLLQFPQAVKIDTHLSIWIKNETQAQRSGSGKFQQVYKGDNRPYQHLGKRTRSPPYPEGVHSAFKHKK